MAKTHKRVLSLILSLVMVLSLLPIQALATGETYNDKDAAISATGVTANKTVAGPDGDGWYTITLSVEGNTTTTPGVTNLPADVVLVVDTSTSMEEKVDSYATCGGTIEWSDGFFGIGRGWYCSSCGKEYSKSAAERNDYICTAQVRQNRLHVAKAAAAQFAEGLMKASNQVRIGVYDFSGSNRTDFALSSDLNSVLGAIRGLSTPGWGDGTDYGLGLSGAQEILSESESSRAKFVVFLSDGEPQSGNNGISQATALQQSGVTIMTVGIDTASAMGALQSISSTDSSGNYYCYSASSDGSSGAALSTVLALIQKKIEDTVYSGTDAVMTDYVNTSQFEYRVTDPRLSGVDGSGTLTWNIGTIGSGTQSVSFQVKPKDNVYGDQLHTNTDVTLGFNSSQQNNQWVTFGKGAIGDPTVNVAAPTYSYTVNYYKDSVAAENLVSSTSDRAEEGTEIPYNKTVPSSLVGYKFGSVDPVNPIVSSADDNVVNVVFVRDDENTHELTYYVQYYKDGVAADKDTITESVWVGSNVIPVDTGKINTTNKYTGYRFDAETTGPIPATIHENGTINVYYVADTYTVKYNKNASDATGTMADQTFTCGVGGTLNANAFSRPNYTFQGWATSSDGEVVYADQANVQDLAAAGGEITLYAVWDEQTATINYVAKEGGSVSRTTETVGLDTGTVQGSTATANEGYYFVGWYDNAECTGIALSTNANYVPTMPTTTGTVTYYAKFAEKKTLTIQITGNSATETYSGDKQSVSGYTVGTVLPEGVSVALKASGAATASGTNVGTYPMGLTKDSFDVTAPAGYDVTLNVTDGTLTINKATLTVKADDKTKTYDGNPYTGFTSTITGFKGTDTASVVTGEVTYTGTAVDAVNKGEYVITPVVTGLSATNYDFVSANGKLTITAKTLTAEDLTFTANDKVYDGNTTATGTVGFVTPIEDLTVSADFMTFADKNVADDKIVTASGLSLGGAAAGNYTLDVTELTAKANITQAPLDVTVNFQDRVYAEGDTSVTVSGATITSGLISGDTVTASASGTGTMTNAYVGSGKDVTSAVQPTLDGADAANYTIGNVTYGNVTILGQVTYDANAGDDTVSGMPTDDKTYELNDPVPIVGGEPTRQNYTFAGWMLREDDTGTVTEGTMEETGLTFYAKWTRNTYQVEVQYQISDDGTIFTDTTYTDDTQTNPFTVNAGESWTVVVGTGTGSDNYTAPATLIVGDKTYVYDAKATKNDLTGNGAETVILKYGLDEKGNGNDGEDPDGTPDYYQVFFKYAAVGSGRVNPKAYTYTSEDIPSGTISVTHPVQATPNLGVRVSAWKDANGAVVKAGAVDNRPVPLGEVALANVQAGATYTYTAYFEKIVYTVTGSIDHGTIVNGEGTALTNPCELTVDYGATAKMVFTPATGYEIYSITIDGKTTTRDTDPNFDNTFGLSLSTGAYTYTEIGVKKDHTVVIETRLRDYEWTVTHTYEGGPLNGQSVVDPVETTKHYGDSIKAEAYKSDPLNAGYTFSRYVVILWNQTTEGLEDVFEGTMPAGHASAAFYYAPRTDLSYTVKYVETDTNEELAQSKTVDGQTFGTEVTETAIDIEGYALDDEASKTITIDVKDNEIIFYYAKDEKGGGGDGDEPDGTPDKYQAFLKFVPREGGKVSETNRTITFPDNATSGTVFVDDVNAVADQDYLFGQWTNGYNTDVCATAILNASIEKVQGGTTITFYANFEKDVLVDPSEEDKTPDKPGDGIPDKYQVTVYYRAVNGTVSMPSTVVTKKDANGNPAENGTAKLAEAHIPTATPIAGYVAAGNLWTPVTPVVGLIVVDGQTFTANYVYIPPYIPPTDPGTDIDDPDVPLADLPGLNTVDHYAYIAGYEDGTVRPNNNITRAEVATIFFRLFTDEYRETYWSTNNPFSDVAYTAWYNNAVSTTSNAGIIAGYPDGTFQPNNYITRAEFATIAARFLSEEYVGPDLFTDISGHWAAEYINRAANAGWINGYPDGSFRPNAYITRAEAMTLVNSMLGRMPHKDHMLENMVKWPDNPEAAWYYEAVQEATNGHDYDWYEEEDQLFYEIWTALQPNRDWAALEKEWSNAYSAPGGEVIG